MAIVLENYNGARKLIATGAPQQEIDDSVIAPDRMWSSKKLIEISTSQFETTGNPVAVSPFAYSPLGVKINFTPKQSGTGDPSPQNVRPITGWDEVSVNVRGKNLLGNFEEKTFTVTGVTWNIENDRINARGETGDSFSTTGNDFNIIFPVPPATYSLSYKISDENIQFIVVFLKSDESVIAYLNNNGSYTLTENNANIRIYAQVPSNRVVNGTISEIQIEVNSTPTPYEPYQPGTTATLTLPEIIYGGTVDAVTGMGSKEWGYVEFDGTESWLLYNNSSDVVKTFYVDIGVESYTNYINILCDRASFLFSTWNKDEPWTIGSSSLSNAIYISVPNDVASAVEQWKSYLAAQADAGTPVTVCYKLATPSAFTSDGYKTIQPLEGVNTIYSNTDSVTVSGRTSWINLMEGGN